MKIRLERTGGIANFAKPLGGIVEVDDLPTELANEAKEMLTPESLRESVARTGGIGDAQSVDRQEIKVGIWQDGEYHEFNLQEQSADADVFDLCNELVNELVRSQLARGDNAPREG